MYFTEKMLHWESGDVAVVPSWLCGLRQSLLFWGQFLIRGAKIMDGGKGIPSSSPQFLVLYFETICGAVLTEGLKNQTWSCASYSLFLSPLFATSFPRPKRIQTLDHQGSVALRSCLSMKWGSLLSPDGAFIKVSHGLRGFHPRLGKTVSTVLTF